MYQSHINYPIHMYVYNIMFTQLEKIYILLFAKIKTYYFHLLLYFIQCWFKISPLHSDSEITLYLQFTSLLSQYELPPCTLCMLCYSWTPFSVRLQVEPIMWMLPDTCNPL